LIPSFVKVPVTVICFFVPELTYGFKGRWSTSEDAAPLEAVKKHGKRWYEVAKDLPGRTDDQCAKRYKEAVDPSIRKL
jgi:hypothetical protein